MKSKLFNLTVILAFVIIIAGCSKKPGSVVTDFLTAKSWDEKKEFIYDAKGLSEEKLAAYMLSDQIRIQEVRHVKKIEDGIDVYRLSYNTPNSSTNSFLDFLVRKKDDVENIDFKPMIGYNSFDFVENKQEYLTEPVIIRCFAVLDNDSQLGEIIFLTNNDNDLLPRKILQREEKEYEVIKELISKGNETTSFLSKRMKRLRIQLLQWKTFPNGLTLVNKYKLIGQDWIER